jgi:hypothetical protein
MKKKAASPPFFGKKTAINPPQSQTMSLSQRAFPQWKRQLERPCYVFNKFQLEPNFHVYDFDEIS